MKPYKTLIEENPLKKGLDYVKYNGISGVWSKVKYKMSGPGLSYNGWYKDNHEADEEELSRQRTEELPYAPLISVLVPVYLTPEFYLRGMIESVQNQTYANWELCIVDGSQARVEDMPVESATAYDYVYSLETERIIRQLAEADDRIKYHLLEENQGICGSLQTALDFAKGDYVVFLNHDDLLTEDALYEIAKCCNEKKYDFIYSDEDKCSSDGTKYSDPSFKPDFSLDLLRAYNYIGHLVAVKRTLATEVSFRTEFDGVEDYDFNLRCIESCVGGLLRNEIPELLKKDGMLKEIVVRPIDDSKIKHISRVLYHSRMKTKSMENSAHKKSVSGELAKKAISQHLERTVGFSSAARTEMKGIFKSVYETPGNPKISIIIPGIDDPIVMEKCIAPLFEKSRYSDFEIIILDTVGDENLAMTKFYKKMEGQRRNIRVITDLASKNTAQLRNKGASYAKGEFLLFLDGNLELIDMTAIGEMVGNCMRDEVGIVGGTLFTTTGNIYKQGIFVGVNGAADYPNRGIKKGSFGYLMNNAINCNYSAVPAGCMMVKTVIFDTLGGFSDIFTGDAAAIDFCLRVRRMGLLVVSVAEAGWTSHEPGIRKRPQGIDNINEKILRDKWPIIYELGDPYYNKNFTREGNIFSLS